MSVCQAKEHNYERAKLLLVNSNQIAKDLILFAHATQVQNDRRVAGNQHKTVICCNKVLVTTKICVSWKPRAKHAII